MILPRAEDAIHRSWLYKLLIEVLDNKLLANNLYFKSGTAATMLGWLDRFSVDLDFDLKMRADEKKVDQELVKIFNKLGLVIKDKSKVVPLYIVKYGDWENRRNSLKLEIVGQEIKSNVYEKYYLTDIDRWANCQTRETMFAHKLVAVMDRFEKHGSISGRDIYDIAYFFRQGYGFRKEVIEERRGVEVNVYLKQLLEFVEDKVTETVITQDLGVLLSGDKLAQVRKGLKSEVLMFLRERTSATG